MPVKAHIDETGRVLIPKTIRDLTGLESDSDVFIEVTRDQKAIRIYRNGGKNK